MENQILNAIAQYTNGKTCYDIIKNLTEGLTDAEACYAIDTFNGCIAIDAPVTLEHVVNIA